ncbi:hypothetical protein [Achromobacter sp. DH1f]|uniref:hypothetical protein n=1 Tax=Achromobacter sp. DH1f TaxID=1397275 RepID=UPI00046AA29D|nr:hypothetical protein [Achromobacter sp. DH1f]
MWRVIFVAVVWWFVVDTVEDYGRIWDSWAYPTKGVTVTFSDDTQLKGDLSKAWTKEWILRNADGSEFHIFNFKSMQFAKPEASRSFAAAWRAWLPAALVHIAFVCYFIPPLFRRRRV